MSVEQNDTTLCSINRSFVPVQFLHIKKKKKTYSQLSAISPMVVVVVV